MQVSTRICRHESGAALTDRVLAIDLGGTRIKSAVVCSGRLESPVDVRPASPDLDGALAALRGLRADLLHDESPAAVGLAVPGLVDFDGRVQALPGKYAGIEGFDLPGWIQEALGAPAVVRNDAVAYAL